MVDIAHNIALVRGRMAAAEQRAGRRAGSVKLMLAAKYQPVENLLAAFAAGERLLGHNMIQQLEAAEEALNAAGADGSALRAGVTNLTHTTTVIGHVQSNKLSHAMHYAQRIDTVDTFKTAQQIARRQQARIDAGEAKIGEAYPILLQVNSSGAPTQFGCEPADLIELATHISETLPLVSIRGLMTIGANTPDTTAVIRSFSITRDLGSQLRAIPGLADATELSMGMTNDMELAIEQGSTEIRIGTAIFGPRAQK
ncbi:MAG: YggS family pyridoxal phosphate-dependent enzyme [Actinomycetaceae bacterium]|nr:YggS family pyridoxal phosphate-dependent enzyme [Arcanobacterium sp.]MDD7686951.1 YggS family pyridoxal phosphate-dependent enzyme [Actinomycetaceae bacterium]MDY5273394.1 YggS family pyridoxal phosphate-dependent enzyme [Arcanobacterium sp.]